MLAFSKAIHTDAGHDGRLSPVNLVKSGKEPHQTPQ